MAVKAIPVINGVMSIEPIKSTVVTKKEFSDVKTELNSKIINTEYKALNAEIRMMNDINKMMETDIKLYKLLIQQDKEIVRLQKQLKYHRYIFLLLSISILIMWIFIIFR